MMGPLVLVQNLILLFSNVPEVEIDKFVDHSRAGFKKCPMLHTGTNFLLDAF
jgi:hypothetical protein